MIGVTPIEVRKVQPKVFVLTFGEQRFASKMLELNGEAVEGSQMRMHVRPSVQHMGLDQVFKYLTGRLEGREKADAYIRAGAENRWRTPNRDPRFVRAAGASDDESERGDEDDRPPQVPKPREKNFWQAKFPNLGWS